MNAEAMRRKFLGYATNRRRKRRRSAGVHGLMSRLFTVSASGSSSKTPPPAQRKALGGAWSGMTAALRTHPGTPSEVLDPLPDVELLLLLSKSPLLGKTPPWAPGGGKLAAATAAAAAAAERVRAPTDAPTDESVRLVGSRAVNEAAGGKADWATARLGVGVVAVATPAQAAAATTAAAAAPGSRMPVPVAE